MVKDLFKQISVLAVLLLPVQLMAESDILATKGDSELKQYALDGAISKVPAQHRFAFLRDPERVAGLVENMLLLEMLADDARKAGYDKKPEIQQRLELAKTKELAEAWMQQYQETAPVADYNQLALEQYTLNKEKFKEPGMVDVSHLLIKVSEERSEDEAQQLAADLLAQIKADPAQMDALILEHSEDPSAPSNKGSFKKVRHGQMVKPFEEASFALQNAGDISELVKTRFGYHIIRLDDKHAARTVPFEEAKSLLIEEEKKRHKEQLRVDYIKRLQMQPTEYPEGALETMVERHLGKQEGNQ